MSQTLASVRGKVFCQPLTKKPFGPIRLSDPWQISPTRDGRSLDVIAEEHGGNAFSTTKGGAVWFWDHETDDPERLASRFYRRVRRPLHRAATSQVRSKEGEIRVG